jgi:hypothetical protein
VYRVEQKKILDIQIRLLQLLTLILEDLKNGVNYKEAYMKKRTGFDSTDDEFVLNRQKISNYLKLFFFNYTL